MSTTIPATMPAWSRATYGPADGFALTDTRVPGVRRGEVLLKVRATSLNAGDVRLMLGDPLLVRPIFGMTRPKYPIRGIEVAGTVAALGPEVTTLRPGDEVVGELVGGGGLAEYVAVPAARLVARPAEVTPTDAATLPVAGGTAWQALDLAGIARGATPQKVLVLGASGGVGTFAVQLAALRGAEVWATCGARNTALVEELGAARVFDHRTSPLDELTPSPRSGRDMTAETAGFGVVSRPEWNGRFDAVIDIVGGLALKPLQRLVAPGGRIVLVTGDGGPVLGPIPRMLKAALVSIGSSRPVKSLAASPTPEVLEQLVALAASGALRPVIERKFAFDDASSALAHVEAGHTVGKVVVLAR